MTPMRITVFTSNQPRHVALIEALAGIADDVFAIQECSTVFPGRVGDFYRKSPIMQRYFERVIAAEQAVFGGPRFAHSSRGRIRQLAIRMGDVNMLDLDSISPALRADRFVVFGASYIRGPLCDLLVARGAVNIHMGVSPYYRGSSTNFWALHDDRPEFVGATIHRLTAGLDSGPMLFHALPPAQAVEPFMLGMQAVKAAQDALVASISEGELETLSPVPQDRALELRYTRNADFTDAVAEEYLTRLKTPLEIGERLATRDAARYVRPRFGASASLAAA